MMRRFILSLLLAASFLPVSGRESDEVNELKDATIVCGTEAPVVQTAGDPMQSQAFNFLASLFSTADWPARWNCGNWSEFDGWFYIFSDFFIWFAYFAIPAVMFFFIYKRRETIPFKNIFILFIAFILLCGLTHLVDVLMFWWPAYRFSALVRFFTAIASIGTVIALVKVLPEAVKLRSPDTLEKEIEAQTKELIEANERLKNEVLQRKKAEEEVVRLNKSLSNFRDAIHSSSIVSKTDIKGNITYVNENFEKISGYGKNELLGQNHRIINSGHHGKDFWREMWRTIARRNTWRNEVKNKRKDGSFYWVDTFIMPFCDESGKIVEYLSIRNDITPSKEAEEELMKLNENLEDRVEEKTADLIRINDQLTRTSEMVKNLQTYAEIGVWEFDVEENNVFWSEEVFRIHEEPVRERLSLDEALAYPDDEFQPLLRQSIRNALEKGESYDIQLRLTTRNKNEVWVRTLGVPIVHGSKTVLNGLYQNITRSKMVEEELAVANQELESFTYSVSHDLRAPLRSISGYAEVLKEDYSDQLDKEGKRVLQVISGNAVKMGRLIDDLLEFSRVGRQDLALRKVDMMAIIKSITEDLAEHASEERSINFSIHPLKGTYADVNMIRQVWINLIGNALKYTRKEDQAEIEIGCRPDENRIVYFIRDNGVGFNMKYSHKLFNVFQRLHGVKEFEGTGVGLALVKRIIDKHGGKIWAEAKINKGAAFYFSLPNRQ